MRRMQGSWAIVLAVASPLLVPALSGCAPSDDGLSEQQKQTGDRLNELGKKTGGDWNKLTPADRDYLVKEMFHGNERTAKIALQGYGGQGPAEMGIAPPPGVKGVPPTAQPPK